MRAPQLIQAGLDFCARQIAVFQVRIGQSQQTFVEGMPGRNSRRPGPKVLHFQPLEQHVFAARELASGFEVKQQLLKQFGRALGFARLLVELLNVVKQFAGHHGALSQNCLEQQPQRQDPATPGRFRFMAQRLEFCALTP
jgi:hypothetical protein